MPVLTLRDIVCTRTLMHVLRSYTWRMTSGRHLISSARRCGPAGSVPVSALSASAGSNLAPCTLHPIAQPLDPSSFPLHVKPKRAIQHPKSLGGVFSERPPDCIDRYALCNASLCLHAHSLLGEHPRDWTDRHADGARWLAPDRRATLFKPYVGCKFDSPAGMVLPLQSWKLIMDHATAFCDPSAVAYEDAIHALQVPLPQLASDVLLHARPNVKVPSTRGRMRVASAGWPSLDG